MGCGIGLFRTSLPTGKAKRDKWAKRLKALEEPWEGDAKAWLAGHGLEACADASALGTIGGGNHFAEMQCIEQIYCQTGLDQLGLSKKHFLLLVHSGSRGIGERLLRQHTERFGAKGLTEGSEEAQWYLNTHDCAVRWAKLNRDLIARRFTDQLNAGCDPILDVCHNSITPVRIDGQACWLHRKGAAPADRGPIVIPGSRGAWSYLVAPVGDQGPNLWSLAHGAGRKWNRASTRERIKEKCSLAALRQTRLGSVVICDDKTLLYEEAPEAYKNIETVIKDMAAAGLIEVIASLRPLITETSRKPCAPPSLQSKGARGSLSSSGSGKAPYSGSAKACSGPTINDGTGLSA